MLKSYIELGEIKMDSKTLIVAGIAVVLLVLGGIVLTQSNTTQDNATAYTIPLKNADFKYFEMKTPVDSKFIIKNALTNESDKGMVYWKNTGNFSKEIDGISINKNLTSKLIPENSKLIGENDTKKVYSSNDVDPVYTVVVTKNDTDLILTGKDLNIIDEMINSTVMKDTKGITTPNAKTPEKTPAAKVVEKTKTNHQKNVETTVDKPKVETTVDKTPKAQVETTTDKQTNDDAELYIGGGIFKTGSALEDKTYAKIYIGGENAGKDIILKIIYSRDGNNLNTGNMVPLTVSSDGYVEVYSADSYSYFPDNAYIQLFDADGNLKCTQNVKLDPDSSTQYF